jgi:hypothetical protein
VKKLDCSCITGGSENGMATLECSLAISLKKLNSQALVFMPVVLAIWEAEFRSILVQSQLGQIV